MTKTVLLGDLVDISSSKRIFYKEYVNSGVPFYRSKEIIEKAAGKSDISTELFITEERFNEIESKFGSPKEGDLLLTSVGTLGIPYLVQKNEKFYFKDGNLTWFRNFKPELNQNYLLYWLTSQSGKNELLNHTIGSTQKALTIQGLKKVKVPLPDIVIQQKIADILGTIDEKIELNRKMNATLEQMGQAFFRHYFINNPKAETWEEKSLDEIANFLNGLAMQKYPKVDGEPTLPVIKIREMSSGITPNTDIASANIPEQYVVHNGDLLFSWSGTLLVKFWTEGEGALNQHLFKVTSEDYPEWLYYYWTKHHLDDFIQTAESKATTMGHIQRKHLKQAMVRVPDVVMMKEIGNKLQPLIDAGKENASQIQTLASLRNILLPKLISGAIKP